MDIIKIKRISEKAQLPSYAYEGDAGMDLYSIEEKTVRPRKPTLIRTGLVLELPKGTEAQVRPRSGLALNHAITVINSPGTIDEGYRGEVGVILINHGTRKFVVKEGMKIAQLIVKPVYNYELVETEDIAKSERGEAGYNSSGTF